MTDQARRRRAVAIAGHSGDAATATAGLTDEEPSVRATALASLDRLGLLDESHLVAAVDDASALVRRRAAELAARHDLPPLIGLLTDVDSSVVESAAWAAGERSPAEHGVVEKLCHIAATHEDALCRESAVAALGAIGDEAGLDTILLSLSDKAPVRRRAVLALAPFDDPRADAAILAALDDRDWQVRQAAEDLGGRQS